MTRNRYAYTCNNPVNYVDPSGHKAEAGKEESLWSKLLKWFGEIISSVGEKISDIINSFSGENTNELPSGSDMEHEINTESDDTTQVEEDMVTATEEQESELCDEAVLREIFIQEEVNGYFNEMEKTLFPTINWGIIGGGNYSQGVSKDSDGRYMVAVGPKILIPDYSDEKRLWKEDFDNVSKRINVVLEHVDTKEQMILEFVVCDIKSHTYNKYPDGHPYDTGDNAYFDVESGYIQTGISYPNSWNATQDRASSEANVDSSVIEFMGTELDFEISDYKLIKILHMKED